MADNYVVVAAAVCPTSYKLGQCKPHWFHNEKGFRIADAEAEDQFTAMAIDADEMWHQRFMSTEVAERCSMKPFQPLPIAQSIPMMAALNQQIENSLLRLPMTPWREPRTPYTRGHNAAAHRRGRAGC